MPSMQDGRSTTARLSPTAGSALPCRTSRTARNLPGLVVLARAAGEKKSVRKPETAQAFFIEGFLRTLPAIPALPFCESQGAEYHYPRNARKALVDAAAAAPVIRASNQESIDLWEAVWRNESTTLFHIVDQF